MAGDGRRRSAASSSASPSCAAARALGVAAAALALGAFAVLACAGLAIIPRYTMLAAAVLAVFAALGLLGWRLLEPGHPWRRRWQALRRRRRADVRRLGAEPVRPRCTRSTPTSPTRREIEGDLNDLADSGAFEPLCGPISVPNHRAVPRLAFDLDVRPSRIVSSSEQRQPRRGYFLDPASPFVIHNFILDPNDPTRFDDARPARLPRRSPATSPGSSTAAAEASLRSDPPAGRSRRGCDGGEVGVGRGRPRGGSSTWRSFGGVEAGRATSTRPRVEDVAAARRARRR